MARLPNPGGDSGAWGNVLNDYLSQVHATDGTLKPGTVSESTLASAVQTKLNEPSAVTSVNTQSGDVTLTKADVGLSNADNTADAAKPVSTAQQTALAAKLNTTDLDDQSATNITTSGTATEGALAATIDARLYYTDVMVHGAIGNGTADDTAAINAAIAAANTAGGGIVVVPPGTYGVTLTDHGGRTYGIVLQSGVTLNLMRGATIKLLAGSTSTDIANTSIICNENPDTISDTDISVTGEGVIDGNAANNTGFITQGIFFGNARRVRVEQVTVKNCRGTSSGPPNETMHIHAYRCVDVIIDRVHVYGDAGVTASGVGFSQVTNGRVSNSTAHNLTYGVGFTFWDSANINCVNCHSYLNGGMGFLTEYSQDVVFADCVAGGITSDQSQTAGKTNPIATGGTQVMLGNGQDTGASAGVFAGFCIDTGTRITLRGGLSAYNGTAAFNANGVRVIGTVSAIVIDGTRIYGNETGVKFENGDGAAAITRAQQTRITQPKLIGPNKKPDGSAAERAWSVNTGASSVSQGLINGFLEPAVGATTVAVANPFPVDCWVRVIGGTVTVIAVTPGGPSPSAAYTTGATAGMVFVPHGGSIAITYSVAPTWDWIIA